MADPRAGDGRDDGEGAEVSPAVEVPPVYERRSSPRADRWVPPVATSVAGVVCAVVAGTGAGGRGVLGAVLGTGLVLAFLWSGLVPLLLARAAPKGAGLALVVVLVNYVLRLLLVFVALGVAVGLGVVDRRAVGLTLVVCSLTWTAAHVTRLGRVAAA